MTSTLYTAFPNRFRQDLVAGKRLLDTGFHNFLVPFVEFLYSIPSIVRALVDAGGAVCANGREAAQKADAKSSPVSNRP